MSRSVVKEPLGQSKTRNVHYGKRLEVFEAREKYAGAAKPTIYPGARESCFSNTFVMTPDIRKLIDNTRHSYLRTKILMKTVPNYARC